MAAHKFFKNNAGTLTEETSVATSAGAGDEGKIPALNATGILGPTIVNSKTSSAGAGDTGKLPALDGTGKLSLTFLPSGIGPDVSEVTASEALAAGDLVNLFDSSGAKCRKADASTAGKEAHGFVLAAVELAALATVYFEGTNDQVTGLTPGRLFLSAANPGLCVSTAPSGAGNAVQRVGFATGVSSMNFQAQTPFILV